MTEPRIGLDIGGTKVDAVVVDGRGERLAHCRIPVIRGEAGVVESASAALAEVTAHAGIEVTAAAAVGIGIPGAVRDGVVQHALNLDLVRTPLARILEDRWRVPVMIDNDVNVAALGAWQMLGGGRESLAYVNVGTGMAAGLVLDGRLWRGARGSAGEIGHISIDPAGPRGPDGLRGGLETYASGSGIAYQWAREGQGSADVIVAARAGNERARAIRTGLTTGIATAVRVLVLTLDVDRVMIGGGLTALGNELLDEVQQVIDGWEAASPFLDSLKMGARISLAPAGEPLAAIGAAALEVHHG